MEQILSGYCRTIDASRIVLVEDGEADCDFEACAYRDVCQIGQQIAQLQKTEERARTFVSTVRRAPRLTAHTLTRRRNSDACWPKTAIRSSTEAAPMTPCAPPP